jgi:hypothetical protein
MSYVPKVNDYVTWKRNIEGWVYFKCENYITLEYKVKPKNLENYKASPIHANNRLLIICYSNQWNELKYIRSRTSIYEE